MNLRKIFLAAFENVGRVLVIVVLAAVLTVCLLCINSSSGITPMTASDAVTCLLAGTAAVSPSPTGTGDPTLCGSQPLVTPISLCRFGD